jgi:eukaryotic-like serine/threonine-protein kinase
MEQSRSPAQAPRAAPQGPDPLIGRTINDRYRIVGVIARGGMGKVYRAEQHPLGRLVALKVLHTNYTGGNDPEFHKRFFLEASIASKLTHPNTVTIFDYGKTDDEIFYIAMELLEGRTLYRALREEGPFSAERTMHIARQICRSLREAHGMGVIHRDLKPANVYLLQHGDEGDVVKVLDFGLVKNLEDKSEELTQTGLFMGSPKYMSPEQIRGDRCDGRADIYALGVMMFEMLTGRAPYDRPNSVHTLMAHIQEEIPPFQTFNPAVRVPQALEQVVRKCMAKLPDQRYATMDEVLGALKRVSGLSLNQTMQGGELRAVDLEISRSVEIPLQGFATARGELLSGGKSASVPPQEFSFTATPANGQTLIDTTLLSAHGPGSMPRSGSGASPPVPAPATSLAGAEPARGGNGRAPFALGMLAAALLGGGALLLLRGTGASEPPANAPLVASPVVTTPEVAAPQAPPVQRSVLVSLRSSPPGAMVLVGDREYGPTPTQVEWTGDDAAIGREVTLRFVRRGYQDLTVTRQIRGPMLEIEAQTLDLAPTQPAPARTPRPLARPAEQPAPAEPEGPGFRTTPY